MMRSAHRLSVIWILSSLTITNSAFIASAQPSDSAAGNQHKVALDDRKLPLRTSIQFHGADPGTDAFVSWDSFIPLSQSFRQSSSSQQLTFLQTQFSLSANEGRTGGSVLLGQRFYDPIRDRTVGGYIAYDIRDTGNSVFSQLGLGLESLSKAFELRFNAYLPVGSTHTTLSQELPGTVFFQENFLRFDRFRQVETAMAGGDIEVGTQLFPLGQGSVKGFAGVYYLNAQGNRDTFGLKGRLEARPNDRFSLSLGVTHDEIFDTRVTLGVAINLLTPPAHAKAVTPLADWVKRQPTIAIDRQLRRDSVIALDPTTYQPYQFWHVTLGGAAGKGTIEAPFSAVAAALTQAQSRQIIYVQAGTNPGIPAITLPDGVTLLSTAPIQWLDTVQQLGVILPGSGSGRFPRITDATALNLVTLGNENRISGFAIENALQNGIFGRDIHTLTVQDNQIIDSGRSGILLENVSGTATVLDNRITHSSGAGVLVKNDQGQIRLRVQDNQILNNQFGVSVIASHTAQTEAQVVRNAIGQSDLGVEFRLADAAQLNATVQDNQIQQTQFDGIFLRAVDDTQAQLRVTGNQMQEIQDSAINLEVRNQARVNSVITDNLIRNISGQGIFYEAFNRTIGTLEISHNTLTDIQNTGIALDLSDQTQLNAQLDSNQLTNTAFDSIFVKATQAAQGTVAIANTQIRNSQDNGITVTLADQTNLNLALVGNQVEGSVFDSILIETTQTAQARVELLNNLLSSGRVNVAGFNLNARDLSQVNARVQGNTITNSADYGSTLQSAEQAALCLQLQNNQSDYSFNLTQIDTSTFRVENTLSTNTATINQAGTITTVPAGTCP
jgi:trimeric autotransporter adhesin